MMAHVTLTEWEDPEKAPHSPYKSIEFYGVFFGDEPAYIVHDPTDMFYEDLKNRNMKSKYEAEKVY